MVRWLLLLLQLFPPHVIVIFFFFWRGTAGSVSAAVKVEELVAVALAYSSWAVENCCNEVSPLSLFYSFLFPL